MSRSWSVGRVGWLGVAGWGFSLSGHAVVVALLLFSPERARTQPRRSVVAFSVVAPAPRPPLPPAPPAKPLPTASRPLPRAAAVATELKPVVRATEPPSPVDLTGVTLTGRDGAGWSSVTGNGLSMDAPISPTVVAPNQPKTLEPVPKTDNVAPTRAAPLLVPFGELAEKPIPPALDTKLAVNYPPAAKQQKIAGKAKVRARIDADGMVRQVGVVSESGEGFGAACQQTLLGSNWSKPRTVAGQAVVTEIYYTCEFRVGR